MQSIELSEEQISNLLVFLDRVEYKGLKEVQAVQDIMNSLLSPMDKQEPNVEE